MSLIERAFGPRDCSPMRSPMVREEIFNEPASLASEVRATCRFPKLDRRALSIEIFPRVLLQHGVNCGDVLRERQLVAIDLASAWKSPSVYLRLRVP